MSNDNRPGMQLVLNAIKLDVLMAMNACASNDTKVALQHLVSAQQTIDKLSPIIEKVDAVMGELNSQVGGKAL